MVSNQIREYATLIQNLRQLPESWVGQVTMPYREALSALMQLRASVDELRVAGSSASEVFARRMNALKLLDMTPEEYLRAELQLAKDRGSIYEETFKADLASIDNAVAKSERLSQLTRAIPSISGNIEGLQNLAMHSTMMAGELVELRTSIQRQHALAMQEKRDQERAIELQTQRNIRALQELEARRRRDAGFTSVPFKYPEWK
jgi:conjugal transfer/entry exclusion protein